MNTDSHYEWINGQKPHLIKNGIRIHCNTENFVPIVVLGLSASSSSSSSTSTPMTSSKEIDHSDHLPAIVSSESVDRQVRGDPCSGTDHHPAILSSESVDRQVRGDPYSSETSEELLNKPTKIPKPNKNRVSRTGTERPVLFRQTGMVARIQRESCG